MHREFKTIRELNKAIESDLVAHTHSIVTNVAKYMADELRERTKIHAEIEYPSTPDDSPSRVVKHIAEGEFNKTERDNIKSAHDWALDVVSNDEKVAWLLRRIGVF